MTNQSQYKKCISMRVATFTAVLSALSVSSARVSNASDICSNSITQCGCTIVEPGFYTVDADLTASQGLTAGDGCIDVKASDVKLVTNGHNITGAGNRRGVGIHLMKGSSNIFIESNGGSGSDDFTQTAISGWQWGLQSEAAGVTSDGFYLYNNVVGILLKGASSNNINNFSSGGNTIYGAWIKDGSFDNQITSAYTSGNGFAGIYIGCSSSGPDGIICESDDKKSFRNRVYNTINGYNPGYGIALELGSRLNLIVKNTQNNNGFGDLYDGNQNCDHNLWRVNRFTSINQGCIQ